MRGPTTTLPHIRWDTRQLVAHCVPNSLVRERASVLQCRNSFLPPPTRARAKRYKASKQTWSSRYFESRPDPPCKPCVRLLHFSCLARFLAALTVECSPSKECTPRGCQVARNQERSGSPSLPSRPISGRSEEQTEFPCRHFPALMQCRRQRRRD